MRRAMLVALWCAACSGPVELLSGLDQPLRVDEAFFLEGDIDESDAAIEVTSIESASGILVLGQQGRVLAGRVGADAHALAVRFADLGSGWWIHEVQEIDPAFRIHTSNIRDWMKTRESAA